MEKYVITIELQNCIRVWEKMTPYDAEINMWIEKAKDLEGSYEISTLDEYLTLLDKVNIITDGEYYITNIGLTFTDAL